MQYTIPFKDESKTYLRDVNIQILEKGEKQTNGIISESLAIDALSLWYEEIEDEYELEVGENEIRWDFYWNSIFADSTSKYVNFQNEGDTDAPIYIELPGELINPIINVYIDDELYQSVTINVTIYEGEKLIYCSKENDFYIIRQTEDGDEEDLFDLDYINFENDNVIRIPANQEAIIEITNENTITDGKIIIYPQYYVV